GGVLAGFLTQHSLGMPAALYAGLIVGAPIFRAWLSVLFGILMYSSSSPMASEDKAAIQRMARMAIGLGMKIRFGITWSLNIVYFKPREGFTQNAWKAAWF